MRWSSWHNHTGCAPRFSYCAVPELSPETYRGALAAGPWDAFALTEHGFALAIPEHERPWPHQWYFAPERLAEYHSFYEDRVAALLARNATIRDGIRVFTGIEVEVAADGTPSAGPSLREYLDVYIGAIHFLPGGPEDRFVEHFRQLDMLLTLPLDILAHPFRLLAPDGPIPDEILEETLLRLASSGVALEINAHRFFPQDPCLVRRAAALDIPVAFGLDAHEPGELSLHTYFADVLAQSGVALDDLRLFSPSPSAGSGPRRLDSVPVVT